MHIRTVFLLEHTNIVQSTANRRINSSHVYLFAAYFKFVYSNFLFVHFACSSVSGLLVDCLVVRKASDT